MSANGELRMQLREISDLKKFDLKLITFLNRVSLPALQISLGIIFIWFGVLKVFGDSPVSYTHLTLPTSDLV